jgi:hypothetical protein
VARVLADLAHQNLVERQGDALIIRKPEGLSAMVEEGETRVMAGFAGSPASIASGGKGTAD